ncbi:hypothetical protein LSH36_627g01026 [Paralvinella palmiformis]|uniref:Galactosyltransferase N-terminal domain-containing protein n=1 Tax=Paralvinella palmiformis TaxID=53620 RepID=A0AAD9MW85_9ANNE|nr:hypothetical protein LSH36_627g01026 [Paralvinella palmiformis]
MLSGSQVIRIKTFVLSVVIITSIVTSLQVYYTFTYPTNEEKVYYHVTRTSPMTTNRYLRLNGNDYVQDLPNKTILAGVCYGKSRHSSVLVDLGIPMRLVAGLGKDRGIVTFVGWKGYPGHTRYRLTPGGNTVNQLSTKFVVEPRSYSTTLRHISDLTLGGHYFPKHCQSKWRIAVIVPFRRREQHLILFLDNIIRFLQLQKIAFTIFVIEQTDPELFNRAALMNIGYLEVRRLGRYDCFIYHDVDLIPEDLTNFYGCAKKPRHLAATRSITNYRQITNDEIFWRRLHHVW